MNPKGKESGQLIVDRLEGEYAVCERAGEGMISLPLNQLPAGIRDGDVLTKQNGSYRIDREASQRRKEEVEAKRRRLFGK